MKKYTDDQFKNIIKLALSENKEDRNLFIEMYRPSKLRVKHVNLIISLFLCQESGKGFWKLSWGEYDISYRGKNEDFKKSFDVSHYLMHTVRKKINKTLLKELNIANEIEVI